MKRVIKVGSRESRLAMVQSEWVITRIKGKHPELEFELVGINTRGDMLLDTRLDKIGGKGLFIKELEHALMEGRVDIAVHSLKDMPAEIPESLMIAAVSEREDPRDVLVTSDGRKLEDLPRGAVIGTSSIRREVQLLSMRPDLQFKTLRGNVLTRINKLVNGEYDAIVLAAAGLKRLGLQDRCVQYFDEDKMIPAVGQGILCIEARKDDDMQYLTDSIHSLDADVAAGAERAFLKKLNGGCSVPLAAHAVVSGDRMKVYGMLAAEDKSWIHRASIEGSVQEAVQLGERLAEMVLEKTH